jgi:hypothetical protein
MARLLWQQRQDIGPAARTYAGMTFVPSKGRSLLFGGYTDGSPSFLSDTWEWDGEEWVQVADTGPTPRVPMLTYDSARNVVVLFGGTGEDGDVFDTWEWDGEAWTQIEDEGPQAPWFTSNVVYDAARQVTILESGSASSFAGKGTWAWDGSAWTQLTNTGPAARQVLSLAFDSVRERVVLFGGRDTTNLELQKDTWEWDGVVWKEVQDIGPSPRQGSGMVGTGDDVLLFGGSNEAGLLGDTWAWDGEHWRQRQDIGPSARHSPGMAWDAGRDRVVLFGGVSPNPTASLLVGDTWEAFEAP